MSTPIKHYQSYINGKWSASESGATIDVENPANGEVFATVPACSTTQAMEALSAAEKAQPAWQALPPIERAGYLYKLADGLKTQRDHFAKLLVMEQGKTFNEALGEVDDTIRYMTYSAEAARRITGEIFPGDAPNEQLYNYRVPYGVTVGLCAFNYPLALIGRKVGPALITGNTMVVKPHDATPVASCEFAKLIEASGLPAGVLSIITGTTQEVGAPLVEDPRTRLITMTGSIRAGQIINAAAAKNLPAQSLELGGKAPFIVMEDADIDKAPTVVRFVSATKQSWCTKPWPTNLPRSSSSKWLNSRSATQCKTSAWDRARLLRGSSAYLILLRRPWLKAPSWLVVASALKGRNLKRVIGSSRLFSLTPLPI
jgi:lactaldehyde dehydrogenase / glycolaldehyde dehydrogenase